MQNLKGKPDTYVQLYLLPGKHKEVKTKVVKNNPNPLFAETIKFQVPQETLSDRMLVLHVVDKDTFTKDDKLGEVQVPLHTVDLNRKSTFVRELGPVTNIVTSAKSPSKSSSSRDSSYVEDGRKSPRKSAPAPGGPSMLRYRIEYDHGARKLLVRVIEARVRQYWQSCPYYICLDLEPQEC